MTAAEAVVLLRPGVSIRVRLQTHEFGVSRLDLRRYVDTAAAEGVNLSVRHLPALRAALEEIEAEAARAGLLRDEAA